MDKSENKVYKTQLCQILVSYNYTKKSCDKVNAHFNNNYNTNENFRVYKLEQIYRFFMSNKSISLF